MPVTEDYAASEPRRSEIDTLTGPTLLEFGSPWCGHCRRAQPLIAEAFAGLFRRPPHQDRGRQPAPPRPLVRREAVADAGFPEGRPRGRAAGAADRRGGHPQCAVPDRGRLEELGDRINAPVKCSDDNGQKAPCLPGPAWGPMPAWMLRGPGRHVASVPKWDI